MCKARDGKARWKAKEAVAEKAARKKPTKPHAMKENKVDLSESYIYSSLTHDGGSPVSIRYPSILCLTVGSYYSTIPKKATVREAYLGKVLDAS